MGGLIRSRAIQHGSYGSTASAVEHYCEGTEILCEISVSLYTENLRVRVVIYEGNEDVITGESFKPSYTADTIVTA